MEQAAASPNVREKTDDKYDTELGPVIGNEYTTNRNEDVRRTGEGQKRNKYNSSVPPENGGPKNLLAI